MPTLRHITLSAVAKRKIRFMASLWIWFPIARRQWRSPIVVRSRLANAERSPRFLIKTR
jgi:hypothetical protein